MRVSSSPRSRNDFQIHAALSFSGLNNIPAFPQQVGDHDHKMDWNLGTPTSESQTRYRAT